MFSSMESNPTLDHEQSTSIKYHENQNQNNSFDNSKSDSENSEYKNKNNLRNNHITISSRMKRQISNADSIKDNQDLMLVFGPITKEELTMKWRLSYFFMNPYEKFQAKRRIPWKLVLQIIKLIILTYQLIDFGSLRSLHITFMETSQLSLKHLYLKDWSLSYEAMPYPPSLGKMAAYTIDDFYDNVDFLQDRYNSTEDKAIGNIRFASDNDSKQPLKMCIRYFEIGDVWSFNKTFVLDTRIKTDCFDLHSVIDNKTQQAVFNIQQFLQQSNKTIKFNGVLDITISFSLRTIHLKCLHRSSEPDCYQFNIDVNYDNKGHNGQLLVLLENQVDDLLCRGTILFERGIDPEWIASWFFNAFVLIVCSLSSSLCLRSFSRAILLTNDTIKFFSSHYPSKQLKKDDLLELVDFWYILIMLNDMLSITGCVYKILIQVKLSNSYEICGLLLGTGSLFAWFGVLRYLALFKSFNILIVTVKLAVPNVLKFLVCAFFIFMGFSICGWIVLGPYHIKFRELTTSLECLYSLINGDDIFATFASMNKVGFSVWLFSRLYLYIFMSFYIYVVLSMFISIIADTYDSIKHPDSDMMTKSFLKRFCEDHTQQPFPDCPTHLTWVNAWQTILKLFGYQKRQNAGTVVQVETGTAEDDDPLILN